MSDWHESKAEHRWAMEEHISVVRHRQWFASSALRAMLGSETPEADWKVAFARLTGTVWALPFLLSGLAVKALDSPQTTLVDILMRAPAAPPVLAVERA